MDRELRSILLVEDNEDDALLFQLEMSRNALDCDIEIANDGTVALDRLGLVKDISKTVTIPDLVVLDIHLPKVSGLEVLRAMRQHDVTRLVPVIVLSNADAKLKSQLDAVVSPGGYLRKPVRFSEFVDFAASLGLRCAVDCPDV